MVKTLKGISPRSYFVCYRTFELVHVTARGNEQKDTNLILMPEKPDFHVVVGDKNSHLTGTSCQECTVYFDNFQMQKFKPVFSTNKRRECLK